MIRSVYPSQDQILNGIREIYAIDRFDLDMTYSKGNFYKNVPQPKLKLDKSPIYVDNVQADFTKLPFPNESFHSVVFDPPFITHAGKNSKIGNRFSSYKNYNELIQNYQNGIKEAYRVLANRGICIMKCQDVVSGGINRWWHIEAYHYAIEAGFFVDDLYILTSNIKIIANNWSVQKHCKKYHSYFWVFKKFL